MLEVIKINNSCLNFFNIHAKESLGKTHKNCLAYPNITSGDYTTYPFFKDSKNLNISFYILSRILFIFI